MMNLILPLCICLEKRKVMFFVGSSRLASAVFVQPANIQAYFYGISVMEDFFLMSLATL